MKLKFVFAVLVALQGALGANDEIIKKQEMTETPHKQREFIRGSDIQREFDKNKSSPCLTLIDTSVSLSVALCLGVYFYYCCTQSSGGFRNNFTLP